MTVHNVVFCLFLIQLLGFSTELFAQDEPLIDQSAFSDLTAMAPADRLSAFVDRAKMAEKEGKVDLALALYREAETLTPALGDEGAKAYLIIKYRELALKADLLDWRRVEHRFEDLRKVADQHPLWTDSQLERALAETEIRLASQPQTEDKEDQVRLLYKEVLIIVQSMGNSISPQLLARSRELGYRLDDTFGERKLLP